MEFLDRDRRCSSSRCSRDRNIWRRAARAGWRPTRPHVCGVKGPVGRGWRFRRARDGRDDGACTSRSPSTGPPMARMAASANQATLRPPVRNDDQGRKQQVRRRCPRCRRPEKSTAPDRGAHPRPGARCARIRDERSRIRRRRTPPPPARRHSWARAPASRARSGSRPCLSSANTLAGACRYTSRPAAAAPRRRSGT